MKLVVVMGQVFSVQDSVLGARMCSNPAGAVTWVCPVGLTWNNSAFHNIVKPNKATPLFSAQSQSSGA